VLAFPEIDPVAFQIVGLPVRWYALAYLAGILLGWACVARVLRRVPEPPVTLRQLEDLVFWVVLGVILGGRLGYLLFYNAPLYFEHPLEALKIWRGGMSFHGGMLGVIFAFFLFCRKHRLEFWRVMDLGALATPIGLFFGRLANFVNGELYGRVTDAPLGMVFPHGGGLPRHPSQLYEAGLEGVALFALLCVAARNFGAFARPGLLSGLFLLGYGSARFFIEFFREPDAHLGFLALGLSMGQLLSLPMLALGAYLAVKARNTVPPR
jgi:phosphatidylglycerol:prolipoprotein diacylglycerol transferase